MSRNSRVALKIQLPLEQPKLSLTRRTSNAPLLSKQGAVPAHRSSLESHTLKLAIKQLLRHPNIALSLVAASVRPLVTQHQLHSLPTALPTSQALKDSQSLLKQVRIYSSNLRLLVRMSVLQSPKVLQKVPVQKSRMERVLLCQTPSSSLKEVLGLFRSLPATPVGTSTPIAVTVSPNLCSPSANLA